MKKRTHFLILVGFLLVTIFSFGQNPTREQIDFFNKGILSWDVPGVRRGVVLPSITTTERDGRTDNGLEPSTVIRGEGLEGAGDRPGAFMGFGFSVEREDAFRDGDYFEFEIVPKEGNKVSLDTLIAKFTRNSGGPRRFLWQYRLDVDCTFTDIGSSFPFEDEDEPENLELDAYQDPIILSTVTRLQNVSFPNKIIFRLYGWGSNGGDREDLEFFGFGRNPRRLNDLTIKGEVSPSAGTPPVEPLDPAVWNGSNWENDIVPSPENQPTRDVVIARGTYNTRLGNISACNLTVNAGARLNVNNRTYVEVVNNVNVNGNLFVGSQGNFVQNNDSGTFTLNGRGSGATVRKFTSLKNEWFHYTYWSSPVERESVGDAFPNVDTNRRFKFLAENYLDTNGDNTDDNADDWNVVKPDEIMEPGVGYLSTSPRSGEFPRRDQIFFRGEFNTGVITTDIFQDDRNTTGSWNLIGNPYPGAIDFELFHEENSDIVGGVAYLWTQSLPLDPDNPGNEGLNFSLDDYAMYNVGVGGIVGANNIRPNKFIPSGQSFFIEGLRDGQIDFTNSMRVADGMSNNQFFKVTKKQKNRDVVSQGNKLWINLTSNNTIFNEILIGYVKGATDGIDGRSYDAPRISGGGYALVYSRIKGSNKKYAIQGRNINSIANNDVVNLGFKTFYNEPERIFRFTLDDFEGNFLLSNSVYIKDNLLDITHDLSVEPYSFTSEQGEFNDRFQIEFKTDNVLSVKDPVITEKNVTVNYLKNNVIEVNTNSELNINKITLYDVLGKQLTLSRQEISSRNQINLFNYKSGLYIIKVKLSDGSTVSKKIIR